MTAGFHGGLCLRSLHISLLPFFQFRLKHYTLGAYLAHVAYTIRHIGDPLKQLPDIDNALMVLMGLGHGAYLAKKIITSAPSIANVNQSSVPAARDATLTLSGSGFGIAQGVSAINVDGVATPIRATAWKDTEITFTIPAASLTAGQKKLSLTVSGQNSNSVLLTVTT
jgi:hypothetical protein